MPGSDFGHGCHESESVQFAHALRHIFAWCGPLHLELCQTIDSLGTYLTQSVIQNCSKQRSLIFYKKKKN